MAGPWYIVVGGSAVDIDTTYGSYTTAMFGFGMPPLTPNVIEQALIPGSLLQSVKVQPRVLQLQINCRGATLAAYHSLRKLLIEAVKPNYGGALTPVELRYDGAGTEVAIYGYYDGGLEGSRTAGAKTPEIIALRFICYDPFFYALAATDTALDGNASIADADYVLRRINGVWSNISTDFNNTVYTINKDPDGNIYIGGLFTNVGDANGDRIVKWNPGAQTLGSLATGVGNGVISAIIPTPYDGIYIGGTFTDVGDVNGDRIAKATAADKVSWTWVSLSTGIAANAVYALALGQDGLLYVGGSFTNVGDGSGDYIVSWNGTAWASLGTGMNGNVNALAVGLDGALYAAGEFATAGGVTVNGVAKWNGTAWTALGTGVDVGGGKFGTALLVAPDGSVYLGGSFAASGGVTAANIARWNGSSWEALGTGLNGVCSALAMTADGMLYAAGIFTTAGGLPVQQLAAWNGASWCTVPVKPPYSGYGLALCATGNDLYIGYDGTGTGYSSEETTVTNGGTAVAYPTITVKRVGGTTARVEYLRNETTGQTLYLNYALLDGETLTITLTPGAKSITSDYAGNVIGRALLPNSDFAEWCLQPGANVISFYVYEAGSPTITANCSFIAAHWSVDGVAA
jgi:hypothetical protein